MGEIQRDIIDKSMGQDKDMPDWPDRCRKCLKANGHDPKKTPFCPPDIACPHYPFTVHRTYEGAK